MTDSLDARIAAIAARQYRNITRPQLLAVGLGPDAIDRRLRAGRLYRGHPGVYSVGAPPSTPLERAYVESFAWPPWQTPTRR